MRVLLVGPARARDTLRALLLDSAVDVAGEFATADEARLSGIEADAILTPLSPAERAPRSAPRETLEEPLTGRELQVLALLAEGLPNKAIAAHLHLSVRTVESHVRHVLTKAGLNNRTQLATWAREHIQ